MAGIFHNQGVWSCGADFLPTSALIAGGAFDDVLGAPAVAATWARFAGKGIQFPSNTYAGRGFNTNLAAHIGGFAYLLPALPVGAALGVIATWMDTAAVQISLAVDLNGSLRFYQSGGLGVAGVSSPIGSASAPGVVVPGAYNFYEFKITINTVTGLLELRVNQAVVITFTGNTRTTANSWVNKLRVGSLSTALPQMDDLYLLDTTAPTPLNDYLGNGRVQTDGPNADSSTVGLNNWAFTTPAGSDFANAANIPANVAQYDSSAVLNDRMSFRFPGLSALKVFFMNTWISAEQDAAGTRAITPKYRSNNVDQVGDSISLSNGAYVYSSQPSALDPNTGLPWAVGTSTDAANCEIGVQVTT